MSLWRTRGSVGSGWPWSTWLTDFASVDLVEVTVQEAKTQLSRLLRRVEAGEEITIRRGKEPVAVLSRAPREPGRRRIWGDVRISMGPDFDEPLEDFEPYV